MATPSTPGPYATDPRLSNPSIYNRQECIDAIREFLHFLCDRLPYFDRSWISEPPVGGWANINDQTFAPLGKTEEAIQLLAHMPYVHIPGDHKNRPEREWPMIKRNTYLYDFHSLVYQAALEKEADGGELSDDFKYQFENSWMETTPPWVICLTNGFKHDDFLLLDTSDGTITKYIPFYGYADEPDYAEDDPRHWREECTEITMPVREYLRKFARELEDHKWLPYFEHGRPVMLWPGDDPKKADHIRSIYREHGWPDQFQRNECREALIAWNGSNAP